MSYNSDLQNNNTTLQTILTTVNNLPAKSDGIDTSDATAAATDIASGKTAYVNGTKITGSVAVTSSGTNTMTASSATQSGTYLNVVANYTTDRLMRAGTSTTIRVPLSNLGNATRADVLNSKTFTSSAGVKQTGTATVTTGGYSAGDAVKGNAVSNLTFVTGYSSVSVTYGTGYSNSNGTLSLTGTKTASGSAAANFDILKGNYIIVSSIVYFIPTNASISYTGSGINK